MYFGAKQAGELVCRDSDKFLKFLKSEKGTYPNAVAPGAGRPHGARGPAGREFDPNLAGGPVRQLTTDNIKVTSRGIDVVEQHVARFGPDVANQGMIQRLKDIAAKRLQPTPADLDFYSHELREFVRYRRQGHRTGGGADRELWNNSHTATLEDYGLSDFDALRNPRLYHSDFWYLFD